MSIYKPSELMNFLQSLGIAPQKRLSQNFLLDRNIIDKIVSASQVAENDIVLEIGPGPGSLTEALLDKKARVYAVEKDPVLSKALNRFQVEGRSLTVFCEDILKFSIDEHLKPLLKERKGKIIANLPYHITTSIITSLIPLHALFSSMTVLVQEEVARRFTAAPGSKEYGSITIFLNFFSKPTYAFTVSNHCFYPKPKVQSAVVKFELREPPPVSDPEAFFTLVHTAFEQRRKMLRSSLKKLYSPELVTQTLEALNLNPLARPEELSLEQFIALFEKIRK